MALRVDKVVFVVQLFGNDQLASGVGGSIERTRAGGMANIGGKKRTDSFNSAGRKNRLNAEKTIISFQRF